MTLVCALSPALAACPVPDDDGSAESGTPSQDPTAAPESSTGGDPSETSETSETDTGTAPATDTDEPAAESSTGASNGCYVLDDSWCGGDPGSRPERFECGSPERCDELNVSDPELGGDGEFAFLNPDAATCILEGLGDGEPGTYVVYREGAINEARTHTLEVLSDGSVVSTVSIFEDKCFGLEQSWTQLRGAEYFDGCAELDDAQAAMECLLDAGDANACVEITGAPACP